MTVLIRGDGIAARCCQHLLGDPNPEAAEIAVRVERPARSQVPAILLNDSALALIRGVFANESLFNEAHPIRSRVVAWRRDAEPVTLPHSGVVISEETLLSKLAANSASDNELADVSWVVHSAPPLPEGVQRMAFGDRLASSARATLRNPTDGATCFIESMANGWLFLLPDSARSGWLLAVGDTSDSLLRDSRLVAEHIGKLEPGGVFPAYPAIANPLSFPGWIACGAAAMAFDPICGDGTANAVREGILGSAVIRAAYRGDDLGGLSRHYNARLTAGFERHLKLCRPFYTTGYGGEWWDVQIAALDRGVEFCRETIEKYGAFRYALNGFDLQYLC